ncbi:TPA: LacI family DNA-binding transcriptional regulator, partial [Escherichia coli]|nr:LacI family DNA-binding transcriptional regulator [Escherichia coli]
MNISDIRAGLRTLVESGETTMTRIAKESGVSLSAVSGFMNDKYNGNMETIGDILELWLEDYHRAAELPEPPRFVETRTARQIWTSMR